MQPVQTYADEMTREVDSNDTHVPKCSISYLQRGSYRLLCGQVTVMTDDERVFTKWLNRDQVIQKQNGLVQQR